MARLHPNGRNRYVRHTRIDHTMMETAAWRDLSGNAVKLLMHLASLENGENNGDIRCGVREGSEATGLSRSVVGRCLAELVDHGFIAATVAGHFSVKTRIATCWRLTWVVWPGHSGPTTEYRAWSPKAPALVTVKCPTGGTVHKAEPA